MKNEIGDMLRDWASKQNSSDGQMRDLASRIRTEIAHDRFTDTVPDCRIALGGRLAYAVLGAALTVVVLLAMLMPYVKNQKPNNGSVLVAAVLKDDGSALASISPKKLQGKTVLWRNVSDLFNHNLKWICESNGDMGVGVDSLVSDNETDNAKPVMVHMTTLARKAGENAWKNVWGADIIMGGEQTVEVVPDKESNTKLALWVFPLEDGKIAVDSSFTLDMPTRMSSTKTYVTENGKPFEVMSVNDGDTEYKVYQTVQKL